MNNEEIKEIIQKLLAAMEISGEIEVVLEETVHVTRFHIKTDKAHLLIGNQGVHLTALSHIIRKIVERRLGRNDQEQGGFIVDVDDYQSKKIAEIKEKTGLLAERARYFKIDIEMDPMPAYERMIVHAILADTPSIKTESTGEGKNRRVVVRYVGE